MLADYLNTLQEVEATTATLDEPDHGLTEEVLEAADVLIWWGHTAHGEVQDDIVQRVQKRVLEGMGLIVLHSGHFSKIFKTLLGTHCSLKWREVAEKERLWNIEPHTQSPRESASISNYQIRKCMVNVSTFRLRIKSSFCPGLKAVKYFEADAPGSAETGGSFISAPVMRPIPFLQRADPEGDWECGALGSRSTGKNSVCLPQCQTIGNPFSQRCGFWEHRDLARRVVAG